jgi:hypothetical protein
MTELAIVAGLALVYFVTRKQAPATAAGAGSPAPRSSGVTDRSTTPKGAGGVGTDAKGGYDANKNLQPSPYDPQPNYTSPVPNSPVDPYVASSEPPDWQPDWSNGTVEGAATPTDSGTSSGDSTPDWAPPDWGS